MQNSNVLGKPHKDIDYDIRTANTNQTIHSIEIHDLTRFSDSVLSNHTIPYARFKLQVSID